MNKLEAEHIARLARLKFDEKELENIAKDMTGILKWIEVLQGVDTSSVKSLEDDSRSLYCREDEVTIGSLEEKLIENTKNSYEHFFTVPKVVE